MCEIYSNQCSKKWSFKKHCIDYDILEIHRTRVCKFLKKKKTQNLIYEKNPMHVIILEATDFMLLKNKVK